MFDDTTPDDCSVPTVVGAGVSTGPEDDADERAIPDEIHLEFSRPVVAENAAGFELDGTHAEVDGIRIGEECDGDDDDDDDVDNDDDDDEEDQDYDDRDDDNDDGDADDDTPSGSRTIVLELTLSITHGEEPTVSYDPDCGTVRTGAGIEPGAIEDHPVKRGPPPWPERAYVPAGDPDEVRVVFRGEVRSRTDDATMFAIDGDDSSPELAGDIDVDGTRVTLPLCEPVDLPEDGGGDGWFGLLDFLDDSWLSRVTSGDCDDCDDDDSDGDDDDCDDDSDDDTELLLEYDASDEPEIQNLVSPNGTVVRPFTVPIELETDDGFGVF